MDAAALARFYRLVAVDAALGERRRRGHDEPSSAAGSVLEDAACREYRRARRKVHTPTGLCGIIAINKAVSQVDLPARVGGVDVDAATSCCSVAVDAAAVKVHDAAADEHATSTATEVVVDLAANELDVAAIDADAAAGVVLAVGDVQPDQLHVAARDVQHATVAWSSVVCGERRGVRLPVLVC